MVLGFLLAIGSGCGKQIHNPSAAPQSEDSWKLFNHRIINTNQAREVATETVQSGDFSGQNLRLLIWTNYLSAELLQDFKQAFMTRVTVTYFASNEELYRRIKSGERYDVAMPSDHMVERLINEDYLAEISQARLSNIRYLAPNHVTNHYDPGNKFSIPYLWGTLGIGYNSQKISFAPRSWRILFGLTPQETNELSGKVSLLEEPRDIIGTALIYLGLSPNTRHTNELVQAVALIRSQADLAHFRYDSEGVSDALVAGSTYAALAWSGDVAKAMARNPKIRYSIPEEGLLMFVDNLVILKSAPPEQRLLAEKFIDFLLRPSVAATVCNYSFYASTLPEAKFGINREIVNGPPYMLPENPSKIFSLRYDPVTQVFLDSIWSQSGILSQKNHPVSSTGPGKTPPP